MYAVKIHTVDFPRPLHSSVNNLKEGLKPAELMGVAHLFRQLPPTSSAPLATVADVYARSTLVFIVAVPSYFSSDDFLRFCGTEANHFDEVLFLRNEGMEDRYSVLIRLEDRFSADGFYCSYNNKKFKPPGVEACHINFLQAVQYTDSAEIASRPPSDYTQLPSCPVCLERLDPDTSGINTTTQCDHSFNCSCASKWTYMSCPVCRLCQQQEEQPSCAECGTFEDLWICLICGFVGCGRYKKGHARAHWSEKKHNFSLELQKPQKQIWDYVGDRYVHRLNQSKAGGKSAVVSSRCSPVEECETCGYDEEEEIDGAIFNSKIGAILDEYNHLLTSQLDTQRQHYESLLAEAKSSRESSTTKAVEKAIFSRTHELQDKLAKYEEEKKAVADRNQELTKKQQILQNKFREIEDRKKSSLKAKDETIVDLQEQIRDLKVYVEAQKKLASTSDLDGVRGGTVLSVEPNQSSPNSKRRTKSGRRRN